MVSHVELLMQTPADYTNPSVDYPSFFMIILGNLFCIKRLTVHIHSKTFFLKILIAVLGGIQILQYLSWMTGLLEKKCGHKDSL